MAEKTIVVRLTLKDAEVTKRALAQLGADGQAALKKIESASQPASKGLLALNAASKDIQAGMTAFGSRLGAVGASMIAFGPAGLAAAAGLAALATGLVGAIRGAREASEHFARLEDQSKKLGLGVEALQEWRYAFEQSGVAAETLDKALEKMRENLGEARAFGAGGAFEALRELKIDPATLTATETALPRLIDALAGVEDGMQRAALAEKVFGKGVDDMLPAIERGAERLAGFRNEARAVGLIVDQHLIASAAGAHRQLQVLERIVDVQVKSALIELAPIIVDVAGWFAAAARAVGDLVNSFRDLDRASSGFIERRLAQIDEQLSVPVTAEDDQDEIEALIEERGRLIAELARRRETEARTEPKITVGAGAAVRDRIRELEAEAEAQGRLAAATGTTTEALAAAMTANRADTEIRRLKISETGKEADEIRRLVSAIDAAARAVEVRRQAETLVRRYDPTASFRKDLADIEEMSRLFGLSEDVRARATEDAWRRSLDASREGADGIQRALIDLRDASRDFAEQWEQDIKGVNSVARTTFVDIITRSKNLTDALGNALSAIERMIASRIYDRMFGPLFDSALDAFFPRFGGAGGAGGGLGTPTATIHEGGVVGPATRTRSVPPHVFAGAPRFHAGWPGFGADEMPAILRRRERVLTEAQQDSTARTIEGLAQLAGAAPVIQVLPTVHINAPGVTARTQASWGGDGTLRIDTIVEQLEERMADKIAKGQGLAPAIGGRFGLDSAGGAWNR